jgi:RNA polymerase primary sigma factor
MVNEDSPNADRGLINESLSTEINRALQTLTPREADILRKFFGIGVPEKTLEEIGDELHLTRERVRQIKEKAIRKLNTGQRSHILMTYLG